MKKVIVFLFAIVAFAHCEDSKQDCSLLVTSHCSTPATIRDLTGLDGCGFVFELEDGTRLEPYLHQFFCGTPPLPKEVTEDPLYQYKFQDGKKVFISYTELERVSICMVGPVVKITCISERCSIAEE